MENSTEICRKKIKLSKENKIGRKAASIEDLTDDSLIYIFQQLPITDKLRVECVSRRFKRLSQDSWSNIKRLSFHPKLWGLSKIQRQIVDKAVLLKVTRLCGKYLTAIDLKKDYSDASVDDPTEFEIGPEAIFHMLKTLESLNSFHKIQELQLFFCEMEFEYINGIKTILVNKNAHINDWRKVFQWLIPNCKNILKFGIDFKHICTCSEGDLSSLLSEMTSLKYLHISDLKDDDPLMSFTGSCLLRVSFETIEELIIKPIYALDKNILKSVIPNLKKLRRFECGCKECENPELLFKALTVHADHLQYLSLHLSTPMVQVPQNRDAIMLSSMSKLKSLEKLDVSRTPFINNKFLDVVANNCEELKYLNVSDCYRVSDCGITNIKRLRNLEIKF